MLFLSKSQLPTKRGKTRQNPAGPTGSRSVRRLLVAQTELDPWKTLLRQLLHYAVVRHSLRNEPLNDNDMFLKGPLGRFLLYVFIINTTAAGCHHRKRH